MSYGNEIQTKYPYGYGVSNPYNNMGIGFKPALPRQASQQSVNGVNYQDYELAPKFLANATEGDIYKDGTKHHFTLNYLA